MYIKRKCSRKRFQLQLKSTDYSGFSKRCRRPSVWKWRATVAPSDGHVAPQRSQMATWKSTTGSGGVVIAVGHSRDNHAVALPSSIFTFTRVSPRPAAWVLCVVTSSLLSPRPRSRVSLSSAAAAASPRCPVNVIQFANRRSRKSRRGWARTMCKRSSRVPGVSPGIPSRTSHPANSCARYVRTASSVRSSRASRGFLVLESARRWESSEGFRCRSKPPVTARERNTTE